MMKTVLVTGASRGLGLAICARLLADGYAVVGVSRAKTEEFTALEQRFPGAARFSVADLSETARLPDIARDWAKELPGLYGLVNNAAVGLDGVLGTMHVSDIGRVLETNVLAPIILTKYLSRAMLSRGTGRIVNISSIIARTGFSGLSVYGASKAAMEGFTRSLSRELGRRNITVNCVAPGYMETAMTSGLQGERLDSIRRRAPLGLAAPDDVAGAVSYLMSDGAAKVTGAIMTVDGGSTA